MEETERIYKKVKEQFEKVKSHYSSILGRFNRNMSLKDQKSLDNCIGVLLSLSMGNSVRDEVRHAEHYTLAYNDTMHYKVGELSEQILNYLTRFRNTGIKKLEIVLDT